MAQPKSSAGRMRKLRDRKKCGTVVIRGVELRNAGVEALIARGWLDAEARNNPAQVRAALVQMINDTLCERPGPQPFRRALKVVSFGLL